MALSDVEQAVLEAVGALDAEQVERGASGSISAAAVEDMHRDVDTGDRTLDEVMQALVEQGYLTAKPVTITHWQSNPAGLSVVYGYNLTHKGRDAVTG